MTNCSNDGTAAFGTTAAALHGIGDFFLSPYQIAVPERFNSRRDNTKYVVSKISPGDVTWIDGLPSTTLERTIADLAAAHEERSLVADALVDAIDKYGTTTFSIHKLEALTGKADLQRILADAGAFAGAPRTGADRPPRARRPQVQGGMLTPYRSAAALEMAIKAAARASSQDTNKAIVGFYRHRLLSRVFSKPGSPFVLKGGLGLLARALDARYTRDIDLTTSRLDPDEAIAELNELAGKDEGDFVSFVAKGPSYRKLNKYFGLALLLQFVALAMCIALHRLFIN